jgi:hypothetical protein
MRLGGIPHRNRCAVMALLSHHDDKYIASPGLSQEVANGSASDQTQLQHHDLSRPRLVLLSRTLFFRRSASGCDRPWRRSNLKYSRVRLSRDNLKLRLEGAVGDSEGGPT